MLTDRINRLLTDAGYALAKGKFLQDTYALIELNPHRAALQIHTNERDVADAYATVLTSGGLTVARSPGTFRTLYIGVRGYDEKRL